MEFRIIGAIWLAASVVYTGSVPGIQLAMILLGIGSVVLGHIVK